MRVVKSIISTQRFQETRRRMSRFLETVGASVWLALWILPLVATPVWAYILFYTDYWYIALSYAVWIIHDSDTPKKGGRRVDFVGKLPLWNWLCQYFPMKIVKTAELDSSKNYLFGYHPHGMYSTGLHANFAFEGNGFSSTFPGLKSHFLTLDFNFNMPFFRDFTLAVGGCSVSRESLNFLLSKNDGGNAVFIVPGGAREALYCNPGTEILYLKSRKGFVKVAIENGSPLVPIYSFGESDIYTQPKNPKGSWLRTIQDKTIDIFGACPIMVRGNGILPRRYPVTSVVGSPVHVEQMLNPPREYVEKVHADYMKALSDLYYKHRSKYGHPNVDLVIL